MGRLKVGKFKARYGRKIRMKLAEMEKLQKQRYACPSCGLPYATRVSTGIFECKKCGTKFAAKAYSA